jgi:GNAT superfamily N-acetyltransferase
MRDCVERFLQLSSEYRVVVAAALALGAERHQSTMSFNIKGPYLGKAIACMPILRSLPDWFGIEEALTQYSTEIDRLPTLLACEAERVIGFASLKQHNPCSAEVYVMGIRPDMHRQGIGRALLQQAHEWLKSQGIEYLQVKTLGPSHPDESYAKTRVFYEAMGFRPLEELEQIWDEHNPCLIMVRRL